MGLEPTTLYTLDRALYQLSYRGSSAGWAQISHLIVHLMNRLTMNMYMYRALPTELPRQLSWLGPNLTSHSTPDEQANHEHVHVPFSKLHSRQSALPTELPRQLSWLGPNLTSHSTPDEQANHEHVHVPFSKCVFFCTYPIHILHISCVQGCKFYMWIIVVFDFVLSQVKCHAIRPLVELGRVI